MAFDADEVIKTANELKQAQEWVKTLEEKLQMLVAGKVPLSSLQHVGPFVSISDRVETLINSFPDKDFTFPEIHKEIEGNEPYLRSLLSRMVKDKKIESRGWGKYGAKHGKEKQDMIDKLHEKLKTVTP
jgi:NifB/MoaA-like Fe-S oxidoreductase